MGKKKIFAIDLILIVGVVAAMAGTYMYATSSVVQYAPSGVSVETFVLHWLGEDAQGLLIDDNFDLTSPERYELEDGLVINLERGVHYLGIDRGGSIEVLSFDVRVPVSLRLRELFDGTFEIVNALDEEFDVVRRKPEGGDDYLRFVGQGGEESG